MEPAGAPIEPLTKAPPGRHFPLNSKVGGRFPVHHPDPSAAANLAQDLVLAGVGGSPLRARGGPGTPSGLRSRAPTRKPASATASSVEWR
jgi:hypothetical protein